MAGARSMHTKEQTVNKVAQKKTRATGPRVTIIPRKASGMARVRGIKGMALSEALALEWPDDAHFAAYEPRTVPVQKSDDRVMVRLLHEAKDERPAVFDVLDMLDVPNVRMVALIGDIDDRDKIAGVARPEWRQEQRPRLRASGLANYETRGGYRVIALLPKDWCKIESREDAEEWKRFYVQWCEHQEEKHGLVLDRACKDWTRLYRLPNVKRDGKRQPGRVRGTPREPDLSWYTPGTPVPVSSRASSAAGSKQEAVMARARAAAQRLEPSVEGHGGDGALFKAANEIATIVGEDSDAVDAVLSESYNPRCLPPWDPAKIAREAQRAAERQEEPMARALRRRRELVPAAHDTAGRENEVDTKVPDILVARRDPAHVLLWESPEQGHQPVATGALRLRIQELGLYIPLKSTEGARPYSAEALIERHGRTFGEAVYDFACSTTRYEPDRDRVVVGYLPRAVTPTHDTDVERWLRAIGGDQYPRLEQWIASCVQKRIARLAAALVLLGPPSIGKTLFAVSVAGLWDVLTPVPAGLLIDRFNGHLTTCPIVFDDEAKLFGSKSLSTKHFRDLIQSSERTVERKGRERFVLRGALRLIIAGNEQSDIRFTDVAGPEVVRAVGDRLCVVDVADREQECRAALERLRLPGGYECDRDRIVRHLAWIAEQVELEPERFIGGGSGADTVLAGHVRTAPDVWSSFTEWLDAKGERATAPWCAHEGELLVDPTGDFPSHTMGGVPREAVHAALAPFKVGDRRPRLEVGRKRLWALNVQAVAGALSLDDASVGQLLARLERSKAETPRPAIKGRWSKRSTVGPTVGPAKKGSGPVGPRIYLSGRG
jgi:hypothetical protein